MLVLFIHKVTYPLARVKRPLTKTSFSGTLLSRPKSSGVRIMGAKRMQKQLLEPLVEVCYAEGPDGLMRKICRIAVTHIPAGDRILLIRRMRKPGQDPYTLVFGWKNREELLASGMVRVAVQTLSDLQKEICGPKIRKHAEGRLVFW